MAAEIGTGETRPYSYQGRDDVGCLPYPHDIEASPAAKGSVNPSAAERPGRVQRTIVESPDVEEHELADMLRVADTTLFYYGRLDAFKRAVTDFEKEERVYDSFVDKAMALLCSSLSISVRLLFADEIATLDVHIIWNSLLKHGGPSSDEEGLHALEACWTSITIGPRETMSELMLRIEQTSRAFSAYDLMWAKGGADKRLLIRSALRGHKDWDTWIREISDSAREKEDWNTLRSRLEAAAALRTEVQSLIDKARTAERKKVQGGGDVEGKGPPSSLTCFLCLVRGHVLKDCPLSAGFRQYHTEHKARLASAKDSSAAAQDDDGEETVGAAVGEIYFESREEFISLGNASFKVKSEGRGDLGPLRNMISTQQPQDIVMTATMERKLYHVDPVACAAAGVTVSVRRVLFGESPPGEAGSSSGQVDPYTYAKNRAQIMGSHGSVREGSTMGLNPLQRLYLRTAHTPKAHLLAGLKANAFDGAQTTYEAAKNMEIGPCDPCIRGTMRQETVTASKRDLSRLKPLQEIGFDPVKLSTKGFNGEFYVNFGLLCYGSKLAMIYPAKTESDQVAVMREVKCDWCTPFGHTIRVLHSDFGSIFTSKEMA
ncbi:hypothetical protein B484DRAFT_434484, partial [Ochromonadaceae sp. CCMP2298]